MAEKKVQLTSPAPAASLDATTRIFLQYKHPNHVRSRSKVRVISAIPQLNAPRAHSQPSIPRRRPAAQRDPRTTFWSSTLPQRAACPYPHTQACPAPQHGTQRAPMVRSDIASNTCRTRASRNQIIIKTIVQLMRAGGGRSRRSPNVRKSVNAEDGRYVCSCGY